MKDFLFKTQNRYLKCIQWIVGYVDDKSLILTFRKSQSPQESMMEAQVVLTSWGKAPSTHKRGPDTQKLYTLIWRGNIKRAKRPWIV